MMMTDSEIREAMEAGDLKIGNFSENGLNGTSYDARVGDLAVLGGVDETVKVADRGSLAIEPGQFVLILTCEKFILPTDITGNLGLRSHYARKGFVLLAGLQIDPGFEGHLVVGGGTTLLRENSSWILRNLS